jgi:hypothetical protein
VRLLFSCTESARGMPVKFPINLVCSFSILYPDIDVILHDQRHITTCGGIPRDLVYWSGSVCNPILKTVGEQRRCAVR